MRFNQATHHPRSLLSSSIGALRVASLVFGGLIFPSLFSSTAYSADDERWFEIEVILFSQLGDKSLILEEFPSIEQQATALPKYNKVSEILTHHIYPDVSLQRLQLPECGQSEQATAFTLFDNFYDVVDVKTLAILSAEVISTLDSVNDGENYINENVSDEIINNELTEELTDQVLIPSKPKENNITQQTEINKLIEKYQGNKANEPDVNLTSTPALEETNAENIVLSYQEPLALDPTCRLPLSIGNRFPTEVKGVINGSENIDSQTPYLISKASLQLTDMYQRLKWSKNFKPLLHLGWREAPKSRRQATAFHLFAGENLAYNYEKAMNTFEQQRKKMAEQTTNSDEAEQKVLAKQLALQQAIAVITDNVGSVSDTDEATILRELNPISTKATSDMRIHSALSSAPSKPLQPWTLDGLFRVHLNHYLYITADFNLLNLSPEEQVDHKSLAIPTPLKSINFSQNRRVISGEIHYFDHPYMGMIVQIRKFKRPIEE